MSRVLDIRDLYLRFRGYTGVTDVLHGISLHIDAGERVALVGESGSGKSVTARIVLGILQELRTARIEGSLEFEGQDLNKLTRRQWHALRGTDYDLGLDVAKVLEASEIFKECMSDYLLPLESRLVDPWIPYSPMPGGALTTTTASQRPAPPVS